MEEQQAISREALNGLYRQLGELTHVILERNVQIRLLSEENERCKALLREVQERYGPQEVVPEPTPVRVQKRGVG